MVELSIQGERCVRLGAWIAGMGRTEAELAALGDRGERKKERRAGRAVLGRQEKEESRQTLAVGQPGKAAGETGVCRSPGRSARVPATDVFVQLGSSGEQDEGAHSGCSWRAPGFPATPRFRRWQDPTPEMTGGCKVTGLSTTWELRCLMWRILIK